MEINWEELGDTLVRKLAEDPEFKQFCENQAGAFEDNLRELLETKFVDPIIVKNFKFNDDDDDAHFEFAMNMTYGLIHAFNKYYVTQYLGRKW